MRGKAVAKTPKKLSANEEAFTIQEGLDKVRQNPSMYMGHLGSDMVYRAVKEPVDNSYDEAKAGRNSLIEVTLDLDNDLICVADKGPGIPVSFKTLKKGDKISILTAAFMELHAGGKFNDTSYKTSAGTHGVGVAAVNAISESLIVYSFVEFKKKKKIWSQEFSKGEFVGKEIPVVVKKVDSITAGMLQEKPAKYGTILRYKLDQTIVSEDARRGRKLPKKYTKAVPEVNKIATWLNTMSLINPGLHIRMTVINKKKTVTKDFLNKKDLAWVAKDLAERMELDAIGKPFTYKSDFISCTMIWTDSPDIDQFQTFVNTSPTIDGGYHVKGLLDALAQALKPYNAAQGKSKKNGFSTNDLQIGLIGLFDWCMHGAQYTSQVKDKLASKVDSEVYKELLPHIEEFFKKNSKVAKNIIKRAQALAKGRDDLSATIKSMASVKKKNKGNALPEFLAAAPNAKPHERELIVVEGDSAGGTATNARNPSYQEVMKAGGKPLNGLKASLAKVLSHKEVQGMLVSIGADIKTLDPKKDNPVLSTDKLRVGNILFLADADPDGFHINVLFLAVIYRLLPDMMREGRVFVVNAPLYNVIHKGKHYGGMTFDECRAAAPKEVKSGSIIRAKGWGEVNEDILEAIAFNPETRRLIRINPFASAESEQNFRNIVAENAIHRRRLLGLED